HDATGTALRYRPLAGLLAESGLQLRAFQARGLTGGSAPQDDLTAMAAEYAAELATDDEGPALLLGYSHCVPVVFEMAVLLRDKGIEVDHVFLVDACAPVPAAAGSRNVTDGLT